MTEQSAHLMLVADEIDAETAACEGCQRRARALTVMEADLQNAHVEHLADLRRINMLQGQLDKFLDDGPVADDVAEIFRIWKGACTKPRSQLTADRKKLIGRMVTKYGFGDCVLAVIGAAHTAYTNPKTGTRYDGIDNIFGDADKFERFRGAGRRACASQLRDKRMATTPAQTLQAAGAKFVEDDELQVFYFKCPLCKDRDEGYYPLIVRYDGQAGYCRECFAELDSIIATLNQTQMVAA